MPTLNLTYNSVCYGDIPLTSNPSQRYFDVSSRRIISVTNPKSDSYTIDPSSTLQLFSGLRSTSLDNTTQFTLTLSPLSNTTYRFTNTSGTSPNLRTNRSINLSTHLTTLTSNANLTLTMAATAGDFTSVLVGDTLLIPGTSTGDSVSPFSPLNEGYWIVLAKDGTSSTLQLSRLSGQPFVGMSEAVTPSSSGQVLVYSSTGVQLNDKVTISLNFPQSILNAYVITAVTPSWFEVTATQPLPVNIISTPTTAGIAFYTNAKRYIRFEVDQACYVQLNGDTGTSNTISPWAPADKNNTGFMEKSGPCWSASITNTSSCPLHLVLLSVE